MNYNISSIVLAAGMSKRMLIGNKLLLKVKNKTLLEKTLDNIISANFSRVSVVLGHDSVLIANLLKNYNVNLYYNSKYKEGISSSRVEGVKRNNINSDGVMICLADMPEVSKSIDNYTGIINFTTIFITISYYINCTTMICICII